MAAAAVAGTAASVYYSEQGKAVSAAQYEEQKKFQADALKRQQEQERINLYLGITGLFVSVVSIAIFYYLSRRP